MNTDKSLLRNEYLRLYNELDELLKTDKVLWETRDPEAPQLDNEQAIVIERMHEIVNRLRVLETLL